MAWIKGRDYINNPYEDDMKHNNLDHEITGAYYEQKNTLADYITYAVVVAVAIAIFDIFFPEVVTNFLADVVMNS